MPTLLVAGAGIGGLTAALALADAGADVIVAERAPALREAGAGLQLSPNATAVLDRLGLLPGIESVAVAPQSVTIRRGRDGATLAQVPLGPAARNRFGAPFLVTHRADLQASLLRTAQARPEITLRLGTPFLSYRPVGSRLGVTLQGAEGGEEIAVDGLVGADGLRSQVRDARQLGTGDGPRYAGRTAWRSTVFADWAPAHARLFRSNLWLGRKAHLVHYPVRGGTLINVVAIVEDPWRGEDADLWSTPGEARRLLAHYEGWAPEARALIEAARDWRIWPLFDRAPLARWSDRNVTLLGDAAHPMLPFLAQGAAQAIEDAAALAEAVRQNPADLPAAFLAYEQARHAKATRVQRESRQQARIYHLGRPASTMRDLAMRTLGGSGMLDRYDWLYTPAPPRRPAGRH